MIVKTNIAAKMAALLDVMAENKLDGMVVTDSLDQFYLGGYHFYPGETVYLVYKGGIIGFTRELYVAPVKAAVPELEMYASENRVVDAVNKAKELGLNRVGFDAAKESYMAGNLFKASGFVEADSFINSLREVKNADEIKIMRDACRIAFQTYEHIKPYIKTGMTESEVAAEIERFMRMKGAVGTAFRTIVAFGPSGANPHHGTGDRVLGAEDAVLLDYGCIYNGYCSDITRSWWHGNTPDEEYTKIWEIVDRARQAGIEKAAPRVPARDVDAAARKVITDAGYGPYFTHGTGHGMGLENHEDPYDNQTSTAILRNGNVITVEPGIYLPGKFGVRLEDTIAITEDGCEILTRK